jgi:hypothetical protein
MMERGSGCFGTPLPFWEREEMVMATREELIGRAGELAHHNEMTFLG